MAAALAEMNYSDRRREEGKAEEEKGGENNRRVYSKVEQVASASFMGLLAEFIQLFRW